MSKKRVLYWLGTAAAGLLLATAARAEVTAESLQIQVLGGACLNCHITGGQPDSAIPPIAGRPVHALESKLLAFKRGEEPGATVMTRHAAGYTDDELAALAVYFSGLGRK